jgi:hypothetical protein
MNVVRCYKYNLLNIVVKSEKDFSRFLRAIFLDTIRGKTIMGTVGSEISDDGRDQV